MNYLLLGIVIVLVYVQNIFNKQYALKTKEVAGNDRLFNFIMSVAAFLVFALMSIKGISFHRQTYFMAVLFGIAFICAVLFLFLAIKEGPLSLSALMISFSLLIPTLFGVIFLKERIGIAGYIGIGLLVFSLWLIYSKDADAKPISLKWVIFIVIATVGNGVCSTVQKYHQTLFPAQFVTEFMLIGSGTVALFFLIRFLIGKKQGFATVAKRQGFYPVLCGIANAGTNLIMIILASKLPASIVFPFVSGGGIVLTFLSAVLIFKEKLGIKQFIGSGLGLAAVILLSI